MTGGMKNRVFSLRQDEAMVQDVEFAARVDGIKPSEFIRRAIGEYLASRRADPEFQARLHVRVQAERDTAARLDEWGHHE